MTDYGTPPIEDECEHHWITDHTLCDAVDRSMCTRCGANNHDAWIANVDEIARAGVTFAEFADAVDAMFGRQRTPAPPATGNAYPAVDTADLGTYGFHQEDQ